MAINIILPQPIIFNNKMVTSCQVIKVSPGDPYPGSPVKPVTVFRTDEVDPVVPPGRDEDTDEVKAEDAAVAAAAAAAETDDATDDEKVSAIIGSANVLISAGRYEDNEIVELVSRRCGCCC
jgi:hypothetical protein